MKLKIMSEVLLEEMKKPDGRMIKVNVASKANVDAAKKLGWTRKPGPKPPGQEQNTQSREG